VWAAGEFLLRDRLSVVLEGVVDGGQALHVVDRLIRGARRPHGEPGQGQDHCGNHGDGRAAGGEDVQDSLHGSTARHRSHVYTSSSGIRVDGSSVETSSSVIM